jgi:hypothetical protein
MYYIFFVVYFAVWSAWDYNLYTTTASKYDLSLAIVWGLVSFCFLCISLANIAMNWSAKNECAPVYKKKCRK